MPNRDGTGPEGRGQLTGRGRGMCGMFGGNGRLTWLAEAFLSVVGVVAVDAINPDGLSRRIVRSLKSGIQKRLPAGTNDIERTRKNPGE